MSRFFAAAVIACCIAPGAAGEVQTASQASSAPIAVEPSQKKSTASSKPDSDMVRAAKSGTVARKKTKVILTNADVKKSTGKLTIISGRDSSPAAKASSDSKHKSPETPSGSAELQVVSELDKQRRSRAEKDVAALEKELRRIEQEYYSEEDPNYRAQVIAARFDQTRRQLEKARKELADARDEMDPPETVIAIP